MKFLLDKLVREGFQLQIVGNYIRVFEEMGLNLSSVTRSPGSQALSEFCSSSVGLFAG